MLKRRAVVAVVLVLGLVLGLSPLAFTQEKPGRPERGDGRFYPQIQLALRALQNAERHLARADHDFGGHRAKALELVKQAEKELQEALAWAKANPEKAGKPAPGGAPAPAPAPPPAPKTQ